LNGKKTRRQGTLPPLSNLNLVVKYHLCLRGIQYWLYCASMCARTKKRWETSLRWQKDRGKVTWRIDIFYLTCAQCARMCTNVHQ
jgi:hypothetical protein